MIFDPKKIIVMARINKIVETDFCEECSVKDRVCNYMSIVKNGEKFEDRFTIIIVGDEVRF